MKAFVTQAATTAICVQTHGTNGGFLAHGMLALQETRRRYPLRACSRRQSYGEHVTAGVLRQLFATAGAPHRLLTAALWRREYRAGRLRRLTEAGDTMQEYSRRRFTSGGTAQSRRQGRHGGNAQPFSGICDRFQAYAAVFRRWSRTQPSYRRVFRGHRQLRRLSASPPFFPARHARRCA